MICMAWVSVLMQGASSAAKDSRHGYVNNLWSPVAPETCTVPEVAVYLNTLII